MPVGLEVRREDDDAIVITNLRRHPVLVLKGTTAASVANTITDDGDGSTVTLPNTGTLRAVIPPLGVRFHLLDSTHYWLDTAPGATMQYFMFAEQPLISTTVGIEVYADDGTLMFNSNPANKIARIMRTNTEPAGKTYAIVTGGMNVQYTWETGAMDPGGNPDPDFEALIRRVSTFIKSGSTYGGSTRHRVDPPTHMIFGDDTPDYGEEGSFGHTQSLILDVTGY